MAFIVGVFEATNDGGGSADEFGELTLSEAGFGAEFDEFAGDFVCGTRFFEGGEALGLSFVKSLVQNGEAVLGMPGWFGFVHISPWAECLFASDSKFFSVFDGFLNFRG